MGFEPTTRGLKVPCSAAELTARRHRTRQSSAGSADRRLGMAIGRAVGRRLSSRPDGRRASRPIGRRAPPPPRKLSDDHGAHRPPVEVDLPRSTDRARGSTTERRGRSYDGELGRQPLDLLAQQGGHAGSAGTRRPARRRRPRRWRPGRRPGRGRGGARSRRAHPPGARPGGRRASLPPPARSGAGATFLPVARTRRFFSRPVMRSRPASSNSPMSPVLSQPSASMRPGGGRRPVEVAEHDLRAAGLDLAGGGVDPQLGAGHRRADRPVSVACSAGCRSGSEPSRSGRSPPGWGCPMRLEEQARRLGQGRAAGHQVADLAAHAPDGGARSRCGPRPTAGTRSQRPSARPARWFA